MKNLGHRLGASGTKLENTLEGLLGSFELVSDRRFRYWEFDIKPWDIAAGSIIAKQAGALITGIRGEEFSIWNNQILATNGQIHEEMLQIITSTI